MRTRREFPLLGAVDWRADIYINGKLAGSHEGGYDPFTIDITSFLKKGNSQQLAVRVWDPTTDGPQPRGKQVNKPEGIWYTPVTGIWQTVWLETVPDTYIAATRNTPDLDAKTINIQTTIQNFQTGDQVKIQAWNKGTMEAEILGQTDATLHIANPVEWSPSNPFLYDLKVSLLRNGKVVDEVTSYFAMRKSSIAPGSDGIQRMMINNKFVFQFTICPDELFRDDHAAGMKDRAFRIAFHGGWLWRNCSRALSNSCRSDCGEVSASSSAVSCGRFD